MKHIFFIAIACIVLWPAGAFAEDPEAHNACMADAFRVCWREIPNRHAVYLCLVANKSRLSETCRTAIIHSRPRRHAPGYGARAQYRHHFHQEQ